MNRTVLEGGNIVIAQTGPRRWEISTISLQFLDWIRESFGDWEDEEWSLIYYSGSMSLIVVHDERIIATTMLRWL